jgi:DNA-binding response OmpR family regulator
MMNIEWGPEKSPGRAPDGSTRPRVLVVDDEDSIRGFVERALTSGGYDVLSASSGPEALRLVETQPPFDLFILDVVMPEISGDELGRRLRLRDANVKVLYFTGHSDTLFRAKKLLWENESFADKPLSVKELREAVSLLLFGHLRGPR